MCKKKKRIFANNAILLIILSTVPLSVNCETQKNEENIFVFPSMQMEDFAGADLERAPVVEVIYRGQPPADENKQTSTTISSSEVITQTPPAKGKCFYVT